jgi:hypothetical protein
LYHILNGDVIEQTTRCIDTFLKHPTKVIIGVDAVSFTPALEFQSDGKVLGAIEPIEIGATLLNEILEDANRMHEYTTAIRHSVIKYAFVFYLCPLNPLQKPFHLYTRFSTKGASDKSILTELKTVREIIQSHSGVEVIGDAYDGDPMYNAAILELVNCIEEQLAANLKNPLSTIEMENLIFSDPLHIIKCDRYRKVNCYVASHTTMKVPNIIPQDFADLGIPNYLLNESHALKMDDTVAILFFETKYISRAIEEESPALLALLPSTILLLSIFNAELRRDERYELLQLGFALVYIYYQTLKENHAQIERNCASGKTMTMFDQQWCRKYLATTFSILKVLEFNEDVHLGALGDHFLEHFFGAVRTNSHNTHTPQNYERFVQNIMLKEEIKTKYHLPDEPRTAKDSGVIDTWRLNEVESIAVHLKRALIIYRTIGKVMEPAEFSRFKRFRPRFDEWGIANLLQDYNFNSHSRVRKTTSATRIIATGGLCNMKRYVSHNQI